MCALKRPEKAGPGKRLIHAVVPDDCHAYLVRQAAELGIKMSPLIARILREHYDQGATYRIEKVPAATAAEPRAKYGRRAGSGQ